MKQYTEYQFYLFSQLFHSHFGEDASHTPYDDLYPIIVAELDKFLASSFNVDEHSEYDCMCTYIEEYEASILSIINNQ
jgi:hypothetical protein